MKVKFEETFDLNFTNAEIEEILAEINKIKKVSKAEFNKLLREAFKETVSATINSTLIDSFYLPNHLEQSIKAKLSS